MPKPRKIAVRDSRVTLSDEFEGTEIEGAEIVCVGRYRLGRILPFARMTESGDLADAETALRQFGDEVLVEWNLTDETGADLAATADGFLSLPMDLCLLIVNAWFARVTAVAAPLGQPSRNGALSGAR